MHLRHLWAELRSLPRSGYQLAIRDFDLHRRPDFPGSLADPQSRYQIETDQVSRYAIPQDVNLGFPNSVRGRIGTLDAGLSILTVGDYLLELLDEVEE